MKSRHLSLGIAINSICLLLLLSVYLTSTIVQSAADLHSLKNWLEFTKEQWPVADTQSTAPFLVFHSEFVNGNILGLKKGIFNVSENWLTNPDLSFRYWASEQTFFRSRKNLQTQPNKNLILAVSKWESTVNLETNPKTSLKSISKEQWEGFGFENSDIFTLALKDVSVKYVERIDPSITTQITAYPTAVEGFKSVNFSDSQLALSNGGGAVGNNDPIVNTNDQTMTFPAGKMVKFKIETLKYKVITFECTQGANQPKTVTIKSINGNCNVDNMKDLFKNSKCKKDGTNEIIEILQVEASSKQILIKNFKATTDNTPVKPKSLKTDLLSNIQPDPPVNPPNNGKTVIYKIDPKIISLTKYTQLKGYVRFNGTKATGNDATKDICYTISKTDTVREDVNSVDVYLTLKGAKAGFKLDTINTRNGKTICLFDYVALKNIDDYIMTLVVQGEITAGFSITVTTKFNKEADKKLVAPEGADILASPQWFYYNSIFDNVLKTDDKKAELYACDVISSCYPFKLNDDDQTKFEWFLPKELKNELKKSPFFQIRGLVNSGKVSFVKTPNVKSQEMFNKDFIKNNEQFLTEESVTKAKAKPADANSYYLKFNSNDNTSVINLSLDSIDMRFQKLIIKIDLVNKADDKPIKRTDDQKSELLLTSVTLKNAENNELPLSPESIVPTAKIAFDTFKISSADLFYVKPTQIVTGNKITLTLQLNADVPAKPMPLVKVQLTVDSLSTTDQTSPPNKKATKTDLKMLPKNSNKIEKSEFKLIFTDFIDNADTTLLGKIALNFGLTISSSPEIQIKPENYLVFRLIINQDLTIKYKRVSGTVDEQHKNIITFLDANKDSDDTPVKGVFRVVYFIHSLLQNSGKVDVDIKSFSLEGKATTDKENSKVTQSLAHVNLEYEKVVCVYGNTTTNNVCQLPNFNQITEIKCDMSAGCSNIFDRQLPTSTQIVPVPNLKRRFAPFQLENSKTEKHQLVINRKITPATPTPDFCVDFYYLAKTTSLRVASDADTKNTIELPLTPTPKHNDYTTKICASYFTNDVETVNKLIFYFDNHQELDIDNHYVEFTEDQIEKQTSSPNTDLVLDTGIYISNLEKKQFFDFNHWTATNDKKLFSNLLVYKITVADLKTLAGKGANSKDGSTEFYYETLRTRWIKMPVENAGLKFGLKFNKSNEDVITSNIVVDSKTTVHLISSKRTKNSFPLNKFNNDALTVIEKSLPDEHFMLEIVVTLNMTKISELNVANKLVSDLVIEIENFNINDPCIVGDSLSKLEKCNSDEGTQDKFHNWCERGYNETNFGPNCHCTDAFTGTGCLDDNYCKTQGYTLCRSADKCHNDEDFKQVKCDCNKGEKWNPFLKGCINPAELTKCGENRRPQYTSVLRGIQCVCIEDYIEVSLNATTKACVPFEPCNKEHRKNLSIKIPCPNANTTCQPTGSKTQPGDFQCNCNTGFININEVRTSEAKCLPEVCAKCLGSCKQTGKIYNCDQTFCDLTGYDFNSTTKECKFNGDKFAKLLGCDKQGLTAILGNDKKPACKCVEGQKLDLLSRLCLTECDETATNACKERGASTCKFENGKAQCKCSSTELPYAKANASDWKCISKCSLLEMPDFYEARCGNSFEHCIENGNLPIKPLEDAANSPYITGVFISNITKINIDEAVKNGIDKQKEYCACDLGFIWEPTAKKCFPSTIPTHTISGFEFDLIPTHDLKKYIEDVENAFTNLVAAVIGLDKKKKPNIFKNLKRATKCEKADEKSILCRTSFQSTMTNEQITKKLASACVPAETDKSKCFYVVNPTNTFLSNFITKSAIDDTNFITYESHTNSFSQNNNVLVHNPSINPKVTKEEYCSKNKNTCSSYAYSVCKDDETKPFECLCPVKEKPFFKIIDSKKLSLTENGKTIDLRMETCGIHNMCKVDKNNFGCKSDDALCHFQVELDDVKKEYFGVSYCTCPTGATLSDRSLSCKESCNGFCSNNTASCGQDYLNTKKIICNCKDGFTGSKCEKKATEAKKEAEVSSSKAYLISTIVVSVIAAIALIGLAVLYFKRR